MNRFFLLWGNLYKDGAVPWQQKTVVLYHEESLGDSFAYVALLDEAQEVFLEPSYMVSEGSLDTDPLHTSYYAKLWETYAYEKCFVQKYSLCCIG